jgi:uncharacterized OB-fold protein
MSLVRCAACGRRSLEGATACPVCRGGALEPCEVSEQATVAAATTLRVGVEDRAGRHLVVARLADLAVLASADEPMALDATVHVEDRPDGGFHVVVPRP